MKVLVVYDSFFGNTEKIADAIAKAIASPDEVTLLPADKVTATELVAPDLLIVGSPTRGFRPSEAVQAFLDEIPGNTVEGNKVAAFDTRIPTASIGRGLRFMMKIGGYAAPRIERALKKKGGVPSAPPEGFFVNDKEGPLAEGELERAANWAKAVIAANK
jgi:flavodoxin I